MAPLPRRFAPLSSERKLTEFFAISSPASSPTPSQTLIRNGTAPRAASSSTRKNNTQKASSKGPDTSPNTLIDLTYSTGSSNGSSIVFIGKTLKQAPLEGALKDFPSSSPTSSPMHQFQTLDSSPSDHGGRPTGRAPRRITTESSASEIFISPPARPLKRLKLTSSAHSITEIPSSQEDEEELKPVTPRRKKRMSSTLAILSVSPPFVEAKCKEWLTKQSSEKLSSSSSPPPKDGQRRPSLCGPSSSDSSPALVESIVSRASVGDASPSPILNRGGKSAQTSAIATAEALGTSAESPHLHHFSPQSQLSPASLSSPLTPLTPTEGDDAMDVDVKEPTKESSEPQEPIDMELSCKSLTTSALQVQSEETADAIIKRIREDAEADMAPADSDEEPRPMFLGPKWDASDDSDIEVDIDAKLGLKQGGCQPSVSGLYGSCSSLTELSSDLEEPPNLRNRARPVAGSSARRRSSRIRKSTTQISVATSTVAAPKPASTAIQSNPGLAALLKEKKQQEKKHGGIDLIRTAEEILAREKAAKEKSRSPPSRGIGKAHPLTKQAQRQISFVDDPQYQSMSPSSSRSGDDLDIDDAVKQRILGSEEKTKIDGIFNADKARAVRRTVSASKQRPRLWVRTLSRMRSDLGFQVVSPNESIPPLKLEVTGDPLLDMLQRAAEDHDTDRLQLLLGAGLLTIMSGVPVELRDWLIKIASLHPNNHLGRASLHALLTLFTHHHAPKSTSVTFAYFSGLLENLGARKELLAQLCGMHTNGTETDNVVANELRSEKAERRWRAVSIIDACIQIDLVESQSIPAFFVLLLFIALDPSASPEVQRKVAITLMRIIQLPRFTLSTEIETVQKVVLMTSHFSAAQTRMLLEVMPSYNASGSRMSRWIGFEALMSGMLKGISEDVYISPPPFDRILGLFVFDKTQMSSVFQIGADTDYEDLRDRTEILSYVLTDIETYVAQDLDTKNLVLSTPGGTSASKIGLLCEDLHKLHNEINDNQAAFLDRTEAKDALQRLHMRIHYQYKAYSSHKGGKGRRGEKLTQWLSSSKKAK